MTGSSLLTAACILLGAGFAAAADKPAPTSMEGALIGDYARATITKPPAALKLDPFYEKYVDADGIPVTTSAKVPDVALLIARDLVLQMLSERPDLRAENYAFKTDRYTVVSADDLRGRDPALHNVLEEVYRRNHHLNADVFFEHPARMNVRVAMVGRKEC